MPGLLLGVMGQLDWMNESALTAQKRDGRGWMAGPYLGARLTPNLYFDARLNWGRSSNEVDFLGSFTDKFDTDRALASARLTGDWAVGSLRLRPSAEVIYYQERQNAYQSTAGIPLSAETYTLGRAVFGPELGYRWTLLDKSVMEPFCRTARDLGFLPHRGDDGCRHPDRTGCIARSHRGRRELPHVVGHHDPRIRRL